MGRSTSPRTFYACAHGNGGIPGCRPRLGVSFLLSKSIGRFEFNSEVTLNRFARNSYRVYETRSIALYNTMYLFKQSLEMKI